MATNHNIVIRPSVASGLHPHIDFVGSGNNVSTMYLYAESGINYVTNGGNPTTKLKFVGTEGTLLEIADNLSSGVIFSINDVSSTPLLEVSASGYTQIYGGLKTPIEINTREATTYFNLNDSSLHQCILDQTPTTLALSGTTIGQKFNIRLQQGVGGSKTVTWWSNIKWAGGSPPTLTSTVDKADLFEFIHTSGSSTADFYDGWTEATNI